MCVALQNARGAPVASATNTRGRRFSVTVTRKATGTVPIGAWGGCLCRVRVCCRVRGRMARLLDWPATLVLAVVFGLVLVVFEPLQWIAKAFGKRSHDWMVACMGTTLARAAGFTW